jgi:hypothetical protein
MILSSHMSTLLNHGLTPTICHSTHQSVNTMCPLHLGKTSLESVKMFKYLGVLIYHGHFMLIIYAAKQGRSLAYFIANFTIMQMS